MTTNSGAKFLSREKEKKSLRKEIDGDVERKRGRRR